MTTATNRERLIRFYEAHNPSKLCDIDRILLSFAGNEEGMFDALRVKYQVAAAADKSLVNPKDDCAELTRRMEPSGYVGQVPEVVVQPDIPENRPEVAVEPEVPESRPEVVVQADVPEMTATTTTPTRRRETTPRRMRSTAVSSRGAEAMAAVSRVRESSKSAVQHIHVRLQKILVALMDTDPSSMLLTAVPSSTDVSMQLLHNISQFKSLAAEFVDVSQPLVEAMSPTAIKSSPQTQADRHPPPSPPLKTQLHRSSSIVNEAATATTQSQAILPPHERESILRSHLPWTPAASSGTASVTLVLQPGAFFENLVIARGVAVDIRGSYVGAAVDLRPLCASEPCITIEEGGLLRCHGVRFTSSCAPEDGPAGVHVKISGEGSSADCFNCTFESCNDGVVVEGMGAVFRGYDSTFSKCAHTAVCVKFGGLASVERCKFDTVGTGLRCRDGSFALCNCSITDAEQSAIVTHGTVKGSIEQCTFTRGGDNGLLMSPSTTVTISSTTISFFRMFGLYASKGAKVKLAQCVMSDNGLGSTNGQCL